jgi:hypothetical protein
MTAPKNVRHLTPEELSERLGGSRVPVNTLKKWRATGQGPGYIRVGKYVLYPEPAVEAWEKTRLVTTTP